MFIAEKNIICIPGQGGYGSADKTIKSGNINFHGGDGGNGGKIIFKQSQYLNLNHLFASNIIKGNNGQDGKKCMKSGKSGKSIIVLLPKNCILNIKHNNQNIKIDDNNKEYVINGSKGGLGSRTTKYKSYKYPELIKSKILNKIIINIKILLYPKIVFLYLNNYNYDFINNYLKYKYNINYNNQKILIINDHYHIFFKKYFYILKYMYSTYKFFII